jgi:hypothetical protein
MGLTDRRKAGDGVTLYGWVGKDTANELGLKMVASRLGLCAAVFYSHETAIQPFVRQQMQQLANTVRQPISLMQFEATHELTKVIPVSDERHQKRTLYR